MSHLSIQQRVVGAFQQIPLPGVPSVAATIVSVALPMLGKYISKNDQKWRWIVAIAAFGINVAIFHKYTKLPLPANCLVSCLLTAAGIKLADYILTRRKSIERDPFATSPDVLAELLPPAPSYSEPSKELFYFYVATKHGFSLVFRDSKVIEFTHGCDPIGAVVDPMITDVRWMKVPPDFYDQITARMQKAAGIPAFLTLQGTWTKLPPARSMQAQRSVNQSSKLLALVSGKTAFVEYPHFDLQLVPNTWQPMPQTPNLSGFSFKHFDEALIIWVHEPNDQALGSALQEAQAESNKLEGMINKETRISQSCQNCLDGRMRRARLFSKLPSAKDHPHSGLLIETIRKKAAGASIDSELQSIIANSKIYIDSLTARKMRVDRDLAQLRQYQALAQQLQAAQGNAQEVERLSSEMKHLRCPISVQKPTVQIKQTTPIDHKARLHLHRKVVVEIIDLFKMIQHRRLVPNFAALEAATFMEEGKSLIKTQAGWIASHPQSRISIEMDNFNRTLERKLEDLTTPSWDQFDWLLQKFAEHNVNFEQMRTSEFLARNVAWFDKAVTHLRNLLHTSGQMTSELESDLAPLVQRLNLLNSGKPLYLTKRLSNTGHFLHDVSDKPADPLAKLDAVHIQT